MDAQYTKQELAVLVDVTLDGTGICPSSEFIDRVIPDTILHQYDPQNVVEVAHDKGFRIVECCMGPEYKADGIWIKPDERLSYKLHGNKGTSHGFCPEHEREFRTRWGLKGVEA
jgi:hypothetical protein